MPVNRAGVVLGGGTGERFGETEKALVPFDGDPMVRHVVDALAAVTEEVVVNCREDQREAFAAALRDHEVAFAVDPEPGLGPVAGLGATLDVVSARVVAVVACDMPAVDPTFLRYLVDRLGGNEAAVPRLPSGRLQPAQAVYRVPPLREAAAQSLAAGDGSLHDVVDRLQAGIVQPAQIQQVTTWRSLADLNSPADLEALAAGDRPDLQDGPQSPDRS
ncbi:MAG: molybdenum cofactor guanylyltransferase [Haloarculaceae archaeon]